MKKTVPLSIPNKKINYSPQYRNMVEGENIVFGSEGNRVETINTDVIELLKVKTPEVIQEGNTLVATCATDGAVIFYTTDGTDPNPINGSVYTGPITIEADTTFRLVAYCNGWIESEVVEVDAEYHLIIDYLRFTAVGEDSTFALSSPNSPNVEYSFDKKVWKSLEVNDHTSETITIRKGKTVYLRGNNSDIYTQIGPFSMTGTISAGGDCNTLINTIGGDIPVGDRLCMLFKNCTSLITPPYLPSTQLHRYCYLGMFSGCTRLSSAPELPAMNLEEGCYNAMFAYCESLTETPILPATTLSSSCYLNMFTHCTNLTIAHDLPAKTCTYKCYCSMFSWCESLEQTPSLPATTLAESCYEGMFQYCTNLKTIKNVLPAIHLEPSCYEFMFYSTGISVIYLNGNPLKEYCYGHMLAHCSNLKTIAITATDISPEGCIVNWTLGVPEGGTFYCFAGLSSYAVPAGWTRINI